MALDGRVLLLNQTYEPLGTVSVARAVIMTFKNTVYVEEFDGDRVLHSVRESFPVPSVIRRRTYINVRRRREASGMKRLRIAIIFTSTTLPSSSRRAKARPRSRRSAAARSGR